MLEIVARRVTGELTRLAGYGCSRADDRRPAGLRRHRSRRLPRLRAPDPAGARRARRPGAAADARRPRARHHPQARLRARGALPRGPPGRRPDGRRRSRPMARSTTVASSSASRRASNDRRDGLGRRRHLPGDVLRRHVARPRRLPAARRRRRPAIALGPVALRGRRHQARPPRQGQRRPPDLLATSTSSSGSRASGRSGCTSPSAAAPGPSSACGSTTTWPTTGARRRASSRRWPTRSPATYPPAATYPEPVEHCDVCRWAAECVARRRGRRPPEPRRRDLGAAAAGPRRSRTSPTLEALGDLPLPMEPRSRGRRRRARAGPRAGPDPARGPPRRRAPLRAAPARAGGEPIDPERGLATLPAPSPGDLFLDLEGDPYALDDGLDYLFGVLETDGTFHAFWSRDESGEFSLDGERRAFEPVIDFIVERLRADPNLHIYHYAAVRADRAQAADGPLRHARGRGRRAAARRGPRRPAARGPPVAPGLGRELLDQEDGAVLRLRARDRPARRRLEHRRVRAVARARRGRAARPPTTSTGSSATTATTS